MVAKAANETNEIAEPTEELEEVVPEVIEPVAPGVPGPVPGKRQLGVKEPIIFKWKILGASEGVVLTLFKSVEREEADAQIERLGREGYYKDLRVVDINEKVVQSKPPPAPKPTSEKAKPVTKAVKAPKAKAARGEKTSTVRVKLAPLVKKEPASKGKGKGKAKPEAKSAGKGDAKATKKKVAKPTPSKSKKK